MIYYASIQHLENVAHARESYDDEQALSTLQRTGEFVIKTLKQTQGNGDFSLEARFRMNPKSDNLLTIVSINATIIGILVAVVVAVAVYYKQIVREAELQVIHEADKINSVTFERSAYFPVGSKSPWEKDLMASLNFDRKELRIRRNIESTISKYNVPVSKEDIIELYRYLHFLSDFDFITKAGTIGNDKYIPQDPANRGEEIMSVISYLTQADIFPERPFSSPVNFRDGPQTRLYFTSITEVKRWLPKVESFVLEFKKYKASRILMPATKYIDSLKKRDRLLIRKWDRSLFRKQGGYLDPDYLINDFRNKSDKAISVAENTRHAFKSYEFLAKRYSLNPLFIITLILLMIFIVGIAIPLIKSNVNQFVYVHLPVFLYSLSFIGMLIWLSGNLQDLGELFVRYFYKG